MTARAKTKTPERPSLHTLGTEVERLKTKIALLEQELAALKAHLPAEEVVVLRTVTKKNAKKEIQGLFQSGQTLYYSDIAWKLQLDLPLVVELCQELEKEGEIEVDANLV